MSNGQYAFQTQAFDPGQWDPVSSDGGPSPDGRRMSGCTNPDTLAIPIEEGGRMYQGSMPGRYSLPIDGEEQDRLDMSHHCYKLLLDGRLTLAPFEKAPRRVLDIATGTGIWALEFAEQNPHSVVFATDTSTIQPPPRTENCIFLPQDSEREAWWYEEPFDLIHLRDVGACFHDFEAVLRKSYAHTSPGGWIELQDTVWEPQCVDATMVGTAIPEFFARVAAGAAACGHDLLKAQRFRDALEQVGYVDVQEVRFSAGCGPWPRDPKMRHVGRYVVVLLLAAAEAFTKLLRASGLRDDEVADLKARFTADVKRTDIHWYLPIHVVMARKPYNVPAPYPETPDGVRFGYFAEQYGDPNMIGQDLHRWA